MAKLVNQPSSMPTRKVTGGAIIGIPGGIILVWVLEKFILPPNAVPIPGEVASAMGSLLSVIAAYFVRERA